MKHAFLCAAFLASAGLASAGSADWPQWRGPNHDDISPDTGLLKEWPAGGPKMVWEAKGLGAGYSSISIFGDRVYTAGDHGQETFVQALGLADGKPVWSAKLGKGGPVGEPAFDGPRATPTTDGELVFAVSEWGELACFRAHTGTELWSKDYTKDFGGERPFWGYAESPLIDGDKVVVTPGGSQGALVALNKKTGALLWQSKELTDPAHYSSLIVADLGGVRQYIQLTPASVAGIAAADGKLLWRAPRKGNVAVIPTPICDDGFVYVTSGYASGCNLFKVSVESGKFSAEKVYANKIMANHHGGVIKVGDYVYGYSEGKGWTCQDFKTGQPKWQEREKFAKGSIAYADGRFICAGKKGKAPSC